MQRQEPEEKPGRNPRRNSARIHVHYSKVYSAACEDPAEGLGEAAADVPGLVEASGLSVGTSGMEGDVVPAISGVSEGESEGVWAMAGGEVKPASLVPLFLSVPSVQPQTARANIPRSKQTATVFFNVLASLGIEFEENPRLHYFYLRKPIYTYRFSVFRLGGFNVCRIFQL